MCPENSPWHQNLVATGTSSVNVQMEAFASGKDFYAVLVRKNESSGLILHQKHVLTFFSGVKVFSSTETLGLVSPSALCWSYYMDERSEKLKFNQLESSSALSCIFGYY